MEMLGSISIQCQCVGLHANRAACTAGDELRLSRETDPRFASAIRVTTLQGTTLGHIKKRDSVDEPAVNVVLSWRALYKMHNDIEIVVSALENSDNGRFPSSVCVEISVFAPLSMLDNLRNNLDAIGKAYSVSN